MNLHTKVAETRNVLHDFVLNVYFLVKETNKLGPPHQLYSSIDFVSKCPRAFLTKPNFRPCHSKQNSKKISFDHTVYIHEQKEMISPSTRNISRRKRSPKLRMVLLIMLNIYLDNKKAESGFAHFSCISAVGASLKQ